MYNVSMAVGLPDELQSAYEAANRVPLGLGIFAFLFLSTLGALCLLKPDIVWQVRHLWTVSGGEPTAYYMVTTRIIGVICIVAGVVCLAAAL